MGQTKILIVEDDEGIVLLAERLLRDQGFEVLSAYTGAEALAGMEARRPDLLLIDYALPDMNAQTLLDHLHGRGLSLPFIITTGQGDERIAVDFMKRGALDYVVKDENFWEFLSASVTRAIEQIETANRLKKAEAALRESEEHFRSLFENSPAAIWEFDYSRVKKYLDSIDFRSIEDFAAFLDANPVHVKKCVGLVRIRGVNRATLKLFHAQNTMTLFKQLDRIVTRATYQTFKEGLLTIHRGEKLLENEMEVRTLAGSRRDVVVRWSIPPGFEHTLSRVLMTVDDITERKLTDEALRKLSSAVEQSANIVIITNTSGDIEYVNPKFTEVTGFAMEEVVGRNPRILKSGQQSSEMYRQLWATIKAGGVWQAELINKKRNGELYWSSQVISPIRNANGVITHYVAVEEDISERKLAEAALKQSEVRYRSLVEQASDGIVVTNSRGDIEEINTYGCDISGYNRSELLQMNIRDFIHSAADGDKAWRLEDLRSGSTLMREFRLIRKDGTALAVELNAKLLPDGRMQGIFRDITKRKAYEAGLIEAKENAEEMARLKSAFLANISHELRTPLSGINGFASILSKEVPEEQSELAELIVQSGQRLLNSLNSVLDLTMIDSGNLKLEKYLHDVKGEVIESVRLLQPLAEEKNLQLVVKTPEHQVQAELDPNCLHRILNNLVANAIKFTESGAVTVELQEQRGRVFVSVSDTGIGISPEFMPHIFSEFKQESTGLTRSHEGVGLGLAITRRLVELMDGTIQVESEKGKGTTFTFDFAGSRGAAEEVKPARVAKATETRMRRHLHSLA